MRRYPLRTARSVYVVAEAPEGLVLEHWGDPTRMPDRPAVRRASFETAADVAPLEYAAAGTRYTQTSELLVEGPVGCAVDGARLALRSVAHSDGSLTAELVDDDAGIEVELHWRTSPDHDVVERWARIRSTRQEVTLTRAFAAGWNVPVGPGALVAQLVGTWSREFTPATVDLPAGQLRLGSRQGVTSHEYSPVVALRSRADPGEAYGVALAWSGSWRMQVDAVPFRDVVRVSAGVDDESTVITLGPGEEYETPRMLGVWSADGTAGLASAWHDYQRGTLARPADRPVVYNSWYATGFDVRVEHQLALADVAAGIGAEVFVVDDGWFAGRTSDRAGLGDWHVDADKFPDGLKPLVAGVLERGMRFGLWVEPEAVNPDSDLFREHPDWVYRAGERPLTTMRNQYVLDLGRPEVAAWAAAMLRRLLTEQPISYLKWDMNRAITDGGRPGDPHGREWTIAHTRAYYRLMRLLRDEFPHVTVEACAGGGGRIDNAVLALSDVVWPSDETGPRDRLAIQHGFLSAYPPSVMSSWVTDEPDRLDTAPASPEFRFVVAMAGVLGIGGDLLAWDEATRARARELVALYREIRPVIHAGAVTRLGEPADAFYAVQYTAGSRVVVLVWRRPGVGPVQVRLAGLESGAQYRVGQDVVHGAALRVGGLDVPFALAPDCDVVVLDRLA